MPEISDIEKAKHILEIFKSIANTSSINMPNPNFDSDFDLEVDGYINMLEFYDKLLEAGWQPPTNKEAASS